MSFLQSFPKTEKDIHEETKRALAREVVARSEAERHDYRRLIAMDGPGGPVYGSFEAVGALEAQLRRLKDENEALRSRNAASA